MFASFSFSWHYLDTKSQISAFVMTGFLSSFILLYACLCNFILVSWIQDVNIRNVKVTTMYISLAKSAVLALKKQKMVIIYYYLLNLFQVLIFFFKNLGRELIGMTKGGLLCFSAFEKQRQRSLAVSSCEFQFLQLPFFYSFFNAKLMILIIFCFWQV